MATEKNKASTLPTRKRTLPKTTTNGAKRQIGRVSAAEPEEPEVEEEERELLDFKDSEQDEQDEENDEGAEGDEPAEEPADDEGEPLAAREAEEAPAEAPASTGRRGRPRGPANKKPAKAKVAAASEESDLYSELYNAGMVVKTLAKANGRTTGQILSALGKIVTAVEELDAAE